MLDIPIEQPYYAIYTGDCPVGKVLETNSVG